MCSQNRDPLLRKNRNGVLVLAVPAVLGRRWTQDRQQKSAKAGTQTVTLTTCSDFCGCQKVDSYVQACYYFVYLNLDSPNRL